MPVVNREVERTIVERARARGMTDDQIKQAVLKYREEQPQFNSISQPGATQQPTVAPAAVSVPVEKKQNLLTAMAKPFIKTAAAIPAVIGGISKLAKGDVQGAQEAITKERSFGALGSTRPIGINQDTGEKQKFGELAKDVVGTGAEIASYAVGGGAASQAAKTGLKGAILQGAKQGIKGGILSGALASGGVEAQREGSDLGSIASQGAMGGAIGGVLGGAIGGGIPLAGAATRVAGKVLPAAREASVQTAGLVGRGSKKILEKGTEFADIAKKPIAIKNLHRAGLSNDVISTLETATPKTKNYLRKMVTKVSKKQNAIEVVGENITDIASKLSKKMKGTGKRLGALKRGLREQPIDMQPIQSALMEDAADLRLAIKGKKIMAPKGIPADEDALEVLNDIYKFAGSGNDAEVADLLRGMLRRGYSKKGTPFSSNAQRLMEKYRGLLLESIETVDPKYGQLAREYAERIGALQDLAKLLGYTGDIENIGKASLKAGEVSRRLLGRAAARPTEVFENLVNQAKKAGIPIDVDFNDLLRFADALDDEIGLTQTTGLQGGIQRGTEAALDRVGAGSLPAEAVKGVLRLGKPDADEKIKALKLFLMGF